MDSPIASAVPATAAPSSAPDAIPQTFLTIQALRAIAALMVVAFHSFELWGQRIDTTAPGAHWANGAAGVDIFFVISGFVMVVASRRLTCDPAAGARFLRQRIVRIVPLYWLLTTVKLVAMLAFPALALRTRLDPTFVLGSYIFLPVVDHTGILRPLIPMGWTLTYEFLFYIVFAIALALRTDSLRIVVPAFGVVTALALLHDPAWPDWTMLFSPIVIEFIFGIVLARLTLRGLKLSAPLAIAAIALGCWTLMALPMVSENWRVLTWGLPAFAIVAGAVSLEQRLAKIIPAWLLRLGDASYAIYLSHGFIVPVVILALGRLAIGGWMGDLIAAAICLAGAMLLGLVLHRTVDQPMTSFIKTIRQRPRRPEPGFVTAGPAPERLSLALRRTRGASARPSAQQA